MLEHVLSCLPTFFHLLIMASKGASTHQNRNHRAKQAKQNKGGQDLDRDKQKKERYGHFQAIPKRIETNRDKRETKKRVCIGEMPKSYVRQSTKRMAA